MGNRDYPLNMGIVAEEDFTLGIVPCVPDTGTHDPVPPYPPLVVVSNQDLMRLNRALTGLFSPGLDAPRYLDRVSALLCSLFPVDLTDYRVLPAPKNAVTALVRNRDMARIAAFFEKGEGLREFSAEEGGQELATFPNRCFVAIPIEPETVLYFGLFRAGMAFLPEEKALLELVQPHLVNARKLALARTASQDLPIDTEVFVRAGFTPREADVIFWLTQGKTNPEIAHLMRVRTDTVSAYLRTVFEKMGVENRVAAVITALDLVRKAAEEEWPSST